MNEPALLRAILESPADDTPRLIYADWHEEYGDVAVANFIRLQVQLAEVESIEHDCGAKLKNESTCPACGAYGEAEALRHEIRLLIENKSILPRWLREVALHGGNLGVNMNPDDWTWSGIEADVVLSYNGFEFHWQRGFVAEVMLPLESFERHAEWLFGTWPLEAVDLAGHEPVHDMIYLGEGSPPMAYPGTQPDPDLFPSAMIYGWTTGPYSPGQPSSPATNARVPWWLLKHCEGTYTGPIIMPPDCRYAWYNTAEEARADLGKACVRWGRAKFLDRREAA